MKKLPNRKFVRTTVDLPIELWKRAKTHALEEQMDLKQLIVVGLEATLPPPPQTAVLYPFPSASNTEAQAADAEDPDNGG